MSGHTVPAEDIAQRIESLGLEYRIMTAHTSLVAVLDQVRNARGEWISVEQAVELPEGMDASGALAASRNAPGVHALSFSTARTTSGSLSSYDLLHQKFAGNMDKNTGPTRFRLRPLSGSGWNPGMSERSGGADDLSGGLRGGDSARLPVRTLIGHGLKAPGASDIQRNRESGQRSLESILRVIRLHIPAYRHVYNKHLKIHPRFKGRLTLKVTIGAHGGVEEAIVIGSTTGVPAFDEEIRLKVASWRFDPIQGQAKDVVTFPMDFFE